MGGKFLGELITRNSVGENGRLDIDIVDQKGSCQQLSLSPDAALALLNVLQNFTPSANGKSLTKVPKSFAVGHGRHEPVVLVRFEDDPAYALSFDQVIELSEALLEEAEHTCSPARAVFKQ